MMRPSDRDPVHTLDHDELDDFEDPLEPRSDASLPSRRSNRPALSHTTYSAVFGNCERTGTWSAPDRISVESWFGEVNLDFRDAEIAADGVVEVRANAIFGQVTLKVPRGTEIEMDGVSALFGGVNSKQSEKRLGDLARKWLTGGPPEDEYDDYDEDDPDEEPMLLRVIGNAIFGQITIEVG